MNRDILHSQGVQAAQAIAEEFQKIEATEKSFLAKQGSTSKKKLILYMSSALGIIVFTWICMYIVYNLNLGFVDSFAVSLITGLAITAYVGILTAKVILNRKYYEQIFKGLELINKIKTHLTAYQTQLEQRVQKIGEQQENQWNQSIKRGWDFQVEIRDIEREIAKTEKMQVDFLKPYAFGALLAASMGVGLILAGLMQEKLCWCVEDTFGYGEWIEITYAFCSCIGVSGGTLGMTYFWLGCKKKKLTMYALLWIFSNGLIGLAATFMTASVILAVVWIVIEIVKLIIKIVVGALVIAGICLGAANSIRPQNRRRNW